MKRKARYRVYDAYECYISGVWVGKPELIGIGDSYNEVNYWIEKRDDETDGENYIIIYDTVLQEEINLDMIPR